MNFLTFFTLLVLASPFIARMNWLAYAPYGLGILLITILGLGLSIWLVRRIWKLRWGSRPTVRYMHLRNTGNVPGGMRVWVTSPETRLRVRYRLDGGLLPVVHEKQPFEAAPVRPQAPPATQTPDAIQPEAGQLATSQQPPNGKVSSLPSPGKAVGKAQAGIGAAAGMAGLFASIFNTLGSLLPGEMGRSAKAAASSMQRGTSMAQTKINAPIQKVKQAQRLQEQVSTLKETVPAKSSPPVTSSAPAALDMTGPVKQVSTSAHAKASFENDETPAVLLRPIPLPEYVQMPAILPAGCLVLELHLDCPSPFQGGQITCWLLTLADGPSGYLQEPRKMVERITIRPAWRGYWLLALLLSAIVVLANAAWAGLALTWLLHGLR